MLQNYETIRLERTILNTSDVLFKLSKIITFRYVKNSEKTMTLAKATELLYVLITMIIIYTTTIMRSVVKPLYSYNKIILIFLK